MARRTTIAEFFAGAPTWLANVLRRGDLTYRRGVDYKDYKGTNGERVSEVVAAELVCSTLAGDPTMHLPIIDLDIAAALVPSTHDGHHHLILGTAVPHEDYMELLEVMARCGIIERAFADFSKQRGYSAARLPWIGKGSERADAKAAVAEYVDSEADFLLEHIDMDFPF